MKFHTQIPARGWLPQKQEPYIPSHLKISSLRTRQRSKVKTTLGVVLLLFGVAAMVISLATVQKTNEIIDDSFIVSPNQQGPPFSVSYISGSHYSTFFTQPVLYGEVSIRGENVEFTVTNQEYQTISLIRDGKEVECTVTNQDPQASHQVIQTTVNQGYSFDLPTNAAYKFAFQNPSGTEQVTVSFALKATWMDMSVLIPGSFVLLAAGLPGTTLLAMGLRGKPRGKEGWQPCM